VTKFVRKSQINILTLFEKIGILFGTNILTLALRKKNMITEIIVDPKICSGKPVIKGTRIMVKNILGMVAGGYTIDRILSAYPELSLEQVQAALEYAATVIDEEQVLANA
jgi:uncharacterized protein (DUF433 family)